LARPEDHEWDENPSYHAGFAELDITADPSTRYSDVRWFLEPACPQYRLSHDGGTATYLRAWSSPLGDDQDFEIQRAIEVGVRSTAGTQGHVLVPSSGRPFDVAELDGMVVLLSRTRTATTEGDPSPPAIHLHWFDREGKHLGAALITDRGEAALGGEVEPGRLVILVSEPAESEGAMLQSSRQRQLLFDIATGELELGETGLPAPRGRLRWASSGILWFRYDGPDWSPAPGSLATKLYFADGESLVLLDLAQGTTRFVHGAPD
jgi:hypothetical protein